MPIVTRLRNRNRQAEVMDQPGLDDVEHRLALDALGRINRLSGGTRAFWPAIRDFCRQRQGGTSNPAVRLLDVATGGGDLPIRLWKQARREGLNLEIAGCDRSPLAIRYAQAQASRHGAEVTFMEHDVIASPLPLGYNIYMSSLFLHHLEEPDAVSLLRAMGEAGQLVLIDDLRRGPIGWALAYAGTRLLSRSRVAQGDGPLSVEGAFTIDEARALARQADWSDFEVRSRWPCRFLMIGRRS